MCSPHFDIEKLVRRNTDAIFSHEYNCNLRRLFPWRGVAETKRQITEFGCIWVVVDPGCTVDAHDHNEEEAFIVVSGRAQVTISGQQTELGTGDVAYIPRFSPHQISNPSDTVPFVMVDIYWDNAGAMPGP